MKILAGMRTDIMNVVRKVDAHDWLFIEITLYIYTRSPSLSECCLVLLYKRNFYCVRNIVNLGALSDRSRKDDVKKLDPYINKSPRSTNDARRAA